ncbi:hypothetical protein [Ornithinibacillus bavariensis]|uniref:hypothetical protein n=1 Tax=Ornithinibacillus bavariensis TaxID=545502 RepID=UPI000EDF3D7A|nr:hypothetical protein [Ornithinibacillus sp.]
MNNLSELELKILQHCANKGYTYAALNGSHVRVLEGNERPILKGAMHRVESDKETYFGETLFIPGLFQDVGYEVIELKDVTEQLSLF